MSASRSLPVVLRAFLDAPIPARPAWSWPLIPVFAVVSACVALVAWWRRARDDASRAGSGGDAFGDAFGASGSSSSSTPAAEGRTPGIDLVCVGNVVVGGSGKSPLVRAFAEEALARGRTVAIVSRGYGARSGNGARAGASADAGYLCDVATSFVRPESGSAASGPDPFSDEMREHVELLRLACGDAALERLYVVQGPSRATGLALLRKALRPDRPTRGPVLAIMDDGLQHFGVRPRVRVCVWPLETYDRAPKAAFPLGPYREGFFFGFDRFLARFDAHVWSRLPADADAGARDAFASALERRLARAFGAPDGRLSGSGAGSSLRESARPRHLLALARSEWLDESGSDPDAGASDALFRCAHASGRLGVVCGLARPDAFVRSVAAALGERLGVAVEPERLVAVFLPDHGALTDDALARLSECEALVTSAKDWFRWRAHPEMAARRRRGQLRVLCVKVLIEGPRHTRVEALELLGAREDPA